MSANARPACRSLAPAKTTTTATKSTIAAAKGTDIEKIRIQSIVDYFLKFPTKVKRIEYRTAAYPGPPSTQPYVPARNELAMPTLAPRPSPLLSSNLYVMED